MLLHIVWSRDMNDTATQWLTGLRTFVAEYRRTHPLLISVSTEENQKEVILRAHWKRWMRETAISLSSSQVVAFTSSDRGIQMIESEVATMLPSEEDRFGNLIPLREIEYRLWTKQRPDPCFEIHVNHWSWIKAPVPKQRWREFARWPIKEAHQYWLHRTGTSGPGDTATRCAHLYEWSGIKAVLLQNDVSEQVQQL